MKLNNGLLSYVVQENNLYKLHKPLMWNHELSHAPFLIVYVANPLSHTEPAWWMIAKAGRRKWLLRGSVTRVATSDSFADNLCTVVSRESQEYKYMQAISCDTDGSTTYAITAFLLNPHRAQGDNHSRNESPELGGERHARLERSREPTKGSGRGEVELMEERYSGREKSEGEREKESAGR